MVRTCVFVFLVAMCSGLVVSKYEDKSDMKHLCEVNLKMELELAIKLDVLTKSLKSLETKMANLEAQFNMTLKDIQSGKCKITKPDLAHPPSCADVKRTDNAATDGEYWLYPSALKGEHVRIYCHNMARDPKEFLTLTKPNTGEYPNLGNMNCHGIKKSPRPELTGSSNFTKIRINIQTMAVYRRDYTFATTTGRPVPYGEANDCYSIHYNGNEAECGMKGNFHIDTTGTGLVVQQSLRWNPLGWQPYVLWHRSDDGSVIDLRCGGWCGGCIPDGVMYLEAKPRNTNKDISGSIMRTCSAVKVMDPNADDGEYMLYPTILSGKGVQIYCDDMANNPKEYLTLPVPNKGNHPNVSNSHCSGETESFKPEESGSSEFFKIGINIETLEVNQRDYKFANTIGDPVGYGRATDCYSQSNRYWWYDESETDTPNCGTKGFFTINTSGTGLRINATMGWKTTGKSAHMDVQRSNNGAVITLKCGGFCGGCVPTQQFFLEINPDDVPYKGSDDGPDNIPGDSTEAGSGKRPANGRDDIPGDSTEAGSGKRPSNDRDDGSDDSR